MDTAKVDIRKLQLLNDRINQCIDALNQVRLSVHGLSHTSQPQAGMPGLQQGQAVPGAPFGYGLAGQGSPFVQSSPFIQGLSHTGAEGFESPGRPVWADPLLSARIAQTFPYAYVAAPPVVTIY